LAAEQVDLYCFVEAARLADSQCFVAEVGPVDSQCFVEEAGSAGFAVAVELLYLEAVEQNWSLQPLLKMYKGILDQASFSMPGPNTPIIICLNICRKAV
jgi:hypothetical protein